MTTEVCVSNGHCFLPRRVACRSLDPRGDVIEVLFYYYAWCCSKKFNDTKSFLLILLLLVLFFLLVAAPPSCVLLPLLGAPGAPGVPSLGGVLWMYPSMLVQKSCSDSVVFPGLSLFLLVWDFPVVKDVIGAGGVGDCQNDSIVG